MMVDYQAIYRVGSGRLVHDANGSRSPAATAS